MKTEYELFICDTTKAHAPICVFKSTTPFPYLACGQRFDDQGWQRLDGSIQGSEAHPLRYTIHSIKHVVTLRENKNIFQTGINVEPYHGKRSPAFDADETMSWSEALERHETNSLNAIHNAYTES